MSSPLSRTLPPSGRRCPVIRLNSVDLPAPFGPITAVICVLRLRLTRETARKPLNDLEMSEISSIARLLETPPQRDDAADDAAREAEQQHQQDRAQHERPVFGVLGDLLVEQDEGRRADRRPPEIAGTAKDGHDEDFGRFGPENIVGENPAAEDAVERAG